MALVPHKDTTLQQIDPEENHKETCALASESLRNALAIAIVKSRKEAQEDRHQWKRKALEQKRQLKRFKNSLEHLSLSSTVKSLDVEGLLESLPKNDDDLLQDDSDRRAPVRPQGFCEQMNKSRVEALGHFLTNVHAVNFIHVLKDGTSLDSADRTNSASVMQFVRTTLVGMSPSSLRRTYSKRSADFLERSIGSESGLKGGERSSEIRLIEEHIMWLFDHLHIQELEGTGGAPLCRRGACFEHLSFLADGEVGCGEVLRKAASAVRGTVEKLAVASKESGVGSDGQGDLDESNSTSVIANLFECSLPLLELQEKGIEQFARKPPHFQDRCASKVVVLEEVVADTLVIHDKGSTIRSFLPLLFQRINRVTAATVTLLQNLATCDYGKAVTGAANGARAKYRDLCGRVYDQVVPTQKGK